MKRFLYTLGLICLPVAASAQRQVMTFDTGPASFPDFFFGGCGGPSGGAVTAAGDSCPWYAASNDAFTVNSVDLSSAISTDNRIILRGYTLDYIQAWNANNNAGMQFFGLLTTGAAVGAYFPTSLMLSLTVGPTGFVTVPLEWQGLGAIVFDSRGGPIPGDPFDVPSFNFRIDNLTVTVTPEPTSIAFVGTGLLAMCAVRRRRRS